MDLVIAPFRQRACTIDGSEIIYHPLLVSTDQGEIDLWDIRELERIERVSFFYLKRKNFRQLIVGQEILDAVVSFLQKHHKYQDMSFDCYSFVNTVAGHYKHNKRFLLKFWSLKTYHFWRRRAGTVIFLMNRKAENFSHAAIYIGHGYYLSVHGAGGDLMVATLSEMMKCYIKAKDVMIAVPIK